MRKVAQFAQKMNFCVHTCRTQRTPEQPQTNFKYQNAEKAQQYSVNPKCAGFSFVDVPTAVVYDELMSPLTSPKTNHFDLPYNGQQTMATPMTRILHYRRE
jgi:hypothetical protein